MQKYAVQIFFTYHNIFFVSQPGEIVTLQKDRVLEKIPSVLEALFVSFVTIRPPKQANHFPHA